MTPRAMVVTGGVALLAGVGLAVARRQGDREPRAPVTVADGGAPPTDHSGAAPLPNRSRARTALQGAHLPGPDWEPAALRRLAGWVPAEPHTTAGRALARAWAAPLTVLGLLLAIASGVVPRPRGGALVAAPAGGLFRQLFERRGFRACTLGHVILVGHEPNERLLAHELVHVRQGERLGPLLAPLYLGLLGVYGYARHPLERAARRGARTR